MFKITHRDNKARLGLLHTSHGIIETPFFMPVATKGNIKYLTHKSALDMGYQAIISNALINYFKPGLDIIKKANGLHNFIGWPKLITTDSGGFQLLSESFLINTTKEGAIIRNPFSGTRELITPEKVIDIQLSLKSDIAMILDDVPTYGQSYSAVKESLEKTHLWASRAMDHIKKNKSPGGQMFFGIAQGGVYRDLRKHSIEYISSLGFDGVALGGLAIGEPTSSMFDIIEYSSDLLPKDLPRYLMGVGSPLDMLKAIGLGIDMFDSTFPTSNARHNTLFTFKGNIKIKNSQYKEDLGAIEDGCGCYTCQNFSRAYLHHLMKNKEGTGKILATYHNLFFMQELISRARKAIKQKRFYQFYKEFEKNYKK
jgi:queuine tRNA-ribosyltransferase